MTSFLRSLRVVRLLSRCSKSTVASTPNFGSSILRQCGVQGQYLALHDVHQCFSLRKCSSIAPAVVEDTEVNLESILSGLRTKGNSPTGLELDDIENALKEIAKIEHISSGEALELAQVCGMFVKNHRQKKPPNTRQEIVKKVWDFIQSYGIEPDESHYNALVQPHVKPSKLILVDEVGPELSSSKNREYTVRNNSSRKYYN